MIKRNQIDNLLERVNNNLELYYSNIQKIKVCKGQRGYAIEVVVDGNQIDSYYKNLTKKQVFTALEVLNIVIGNCAYITANNIGEKEKAKNGCFLQSMIETFNRQNLD